MYSSNFSIPSYNFKPQIIDFWTFSLNSYLITNAKVHEHSLYQVLNSWKQVHQIKHPSVEYKILQGISVMAPSYLSYCPSVNPTLLNDICGFIYNLYSSYKHLLYSGFDILINSNNYSLILHLLFWLRSSTFYYAFNKKPHQYFLPVRLLYHIATSISIKSAHSLHRLA